MLYQESVNGQVWELSYGDAGQTHLNLWHFWNGKTHADLQILTVLMDIPVMDRYSSGAATL